MQEYRLASTAAHRHFFMQLASLQFRYKIFDISVASYVANSGYIEFNYP
uniref:Uncharacterized protein n=1 Tax=Anguilla anguilla TaxID=7936 RepID=A0A0E9VFY4_ANGAN